MNLRRTTLIITQRCTLKCKLCLAFVPYYEKPVDMKLEDALKTIDNYFRLVDRVEIFSITGGEPLMHKNLVDIMNKVYSYRERIDGYIDIVTNGTIMFRKDFLAVLEKSRNKVRVIISDYGTKLSPKIELIVKELKERNIEHRIQNYAGDENWLFDGWVDFRDHSLKHDTPEKLKEQALRCIFRQGHYYVINDGELHPCSRSYWRGRTNVIDKEEGEYIDLLDETKSTLEEKREKLEYIESLVALKSCTYCDGVHDGVKRYKPAEQL